MPVIAIIDDREDARSKVARALRNTVPTTWQIVASNPLPNLEFYPSWIGENEISVLILDEKLNEVSEDEEEGAVEYLGHQLMEYLRKRLPELPIFVVTSYARDTKLLTRLGEFEDVIDRRTFYREPHTYTPRFVRASQRYVETYERELADLSKITTKLASGGVLSGEEEQRVRAIQQKVETQFSISNVDNRNQWINRFEETINKLNRLKDEVNGLIRKAKDREMDKDS